MLSANIKDHLHIVNLGNFGLQNPKMIKIDR